MSVIPSQPPQPGGPKRQPSPFDDDAVNAVLGTDAVYGSLARARNKTPAQRKRDERDRKRNKATYDLPVWLTETLDVMSEAYGCPRNEILTMLAQCGIKQMLEGKLNPLEKREVTRSLRFEYRIEVEAEYTLDEVKKRISEQFEARAVKRE